MTATFWVMAPHGERFADGCFDRSVGQSVPWTLGVGGPVAGTATVLEIKVSDDGSGAQWTIALEEESHGTSGT